jgi:hypothetical protein
MLNHSPRIEIRDEDLTVVLHLRYIWHGRCILYLHTTRYIALIIAL